MEIENKQIEIDDDDIDINDKKLKLDLVFLVDCTGSMGSYISSAQSNIILIGKKLGEVADCMYSLVCYRDHPPQDRSYITKTFDFTSDIEIMKTNVNTMSASGGGDGPEAVGAGLFDVLNLDYRIDSAKICVFIADAPPHGLCPGSGDGFPNGCPQGKDPLVQVRKMVQKGIVIYSVACEPSVSSHYTFCKDFFQGIAQISGGICTSLSTASKLPDLIIAGAKQELSLLKVTKEVILLEKELGEKEKLTRKQLADKISIILGKKGIKTDHLEVDENSDKQASFTWLINQNGSLVGARKELDLEISNTTGGYIKPSPTGTAKISVKRKKISSGQVIRVLRRIPQTIPLPDTIKNPEGGYSYKVNDMIRLRRFLCLGSEGGSYSSQEKELTRDNAHCIENLLLCGKDTGLKVVETLLDYSLSGRTAKQNPILFALAICCKLGDPITKKAAYDALPKICRIPTHLFSFIEYSERILAHSTGWGRAHRRAITNWYLNQNGKKLSLAITKYKQRNGWSHRDVLRLSHPNPDNSIIHQMIFRYIVKGFDDTVKLYNEIDMPEIEIVKTFDFLKATEQIKKAENDEQIVSFIKESNLVREHIPSKFLKSKIVWEALFEKMPMTAMIRSLNRMTALGLFEEEEKEKEKEKEKKKKEEKDNKIDILKEAERRLTDDKQLERARIHPFNVLLALKTYEKGKGDKGSLEWNPSSTIVSALEEAFYKSFKFIEPTGLRYMLALDVSASMTIPIQGTCITAREAAAAMALVTARTEKDVIIRGFSKTLVPIHITPDSTLPEAVKAMEGIPLGPTDCAAPMLWAEKEKIPIDVFIIYTDCETYVGTYHPKQALDRYRRVMGIEAKLVIVGMCATEFTLADSSDAGMLDVAGFDSQAPEVIRNFSMGLI